MPPLEIKSEELEQVVNFMFPQIGYFYGPGASYEMKFDLGDHLEVGFSHGEVQMNQLELLFRLNGKKAGRSDFQRALEVTLTVNMTAEFAMDNFTCTLNIQRPAVYDAKSLFERTQTNIDDWNLFMQSMIDFPVGIANHRFNHVNLRDVSDRMDILEGYFPVTQIRIENEFLFVGYSFFTDFIISA